MVPNITDEIVEKQKSLQSGTCLGFGLGFKIPLIVKMEMPDPAPSSGNCNVVSIWSGNNSVTVPSNNQVVVEVPQVAETAPSVPASVPSVPESAPSVSVTEPPKVEEKAQEVAQPQAIPEIVSTPVQVPQEVTQGFSEPILEKFDDSFIVPDNNVTPPAYNPSNEIVLDDTDDDSDLEPDFS